MTTNTNSVKVKENHIDIKEAFEKRYPKRGIILRRYEEANGEEIDWDNVTNYKLDAFVDYLKSIISNNSARTYASQLKAFINLHLPKFTGLSNGWLRILSITEVESTHVTLNEDEVKLIIDYALNDDNSESLRNVASTFAVCCLTGARWIDSYDFKDMDLSGRSFKYISKKTNIIAEIPVSPVLRKLVDRTRKISMVAYNKMIREVCQELNINSESTVFKGGVALKGAKYEFISSHTARQSFATNLYNRGADLEVIRRMMGHTTYEQTRRYINSSIDDLEDNIQSFFSN